MNIRKISTVAFVLMFMALGVWLSGCERMAPMMPDDKTEPQPEMVDPLITIGVAVALTGEYAEPYGLPMQRGLELAREEINARDAMNLTFVTVDAQSTLEGGVAAVQQLVDQGVPAIIGIGISTHLKEAFPIVQDAGIVAFSPISSAAGLSSLGDYIFRTGLATDLINPNGVAATHEKLGYQKVATIYNAGDAYSTSSNEEIAKALTTSGVEILTQEAFETGDTDFSQQFTNIMNLSPDAVFISALAKDLAPIMVQGRATGIPETVPFIVAELSSKEVIEAGAAAEGAITFTAWSSLANTPGNQAFIESYQTKYGIEAEPWAAQAYATLHILANAMMTAESTDAAAIRDALAATMDFPTVLGNFSFDANGEAMYAPVVLVVKDGKLQPFE